jgi:ATP-binding cassette subfamily C protein
MLGAETNQLNMELRRFARSAAILVRMAEPFLVVILCFGIYFALTLMGMKMAVILVAAVVFYRAVSLLTQLQGAYQNLVVHENFVQRVMTKINSAEEAREHRFGAQLVNLDCKIHFEKVSFKFDERTVLDDISIDIPARKFTSIVGPSGSGKSTLIDLITGLYRPQDGHVEIDGIPMDNADIRDWRQKIGYVPQELSLFNDTVFANVALKDSNVTEEDVKRALRQAGAWQFVSILSNGIYAQVGERGTQLSGGERQRISLARALLGRPQLLILDEPTTALDPDTEREICLTLSELSGELTVLAVSHQPALMEVADVVYRLTNGVVSFEASV